ncbi:unnamed protein product [Prunus brigantina]
MMQKHFEIQMLYKNHFKLKECLQSKYRFSQLQLTSVTFRDTMFQWGRTTKVMRRRIGKPKVMIATIPKTSHLSPLTLCFEPSHLSASASNPFTSHLSPSASNPLTSQPLLRTLSPLTSHPLLRTLSPLTSHPLLRTLSPLTLSLQTLSMSNLITSRKAVSAAQSSPPPSQPSAATAPAEMDHLPVGPRVSDAPVSSASSVAQPLSARRRHRPPSTSDTISTDASVGPGTQSAKKNTRGPCRQLKTTKVTRVTNSRINIEYDERHQAASTAELHSSLAHDIGHVVRTHCPMQWKSWKVIPDEVKMEVRGHLSTNYKLEDLDDASLAYVNRLFGERYKQWKSDLHHHFQAFDDPQVALEAGCPKELEGREDSWAWLCAHFLAPEFVNKATVNKGNRKKKTLLHHSGSRPFSYRMDARRRGGSKFPEIDVFGDVYVRPGNELAESIHVNDDGGEEPVGSSGVCLPTSFRYSPRVRASST